MKRRKESNWVKHMDFAILDVICLELAFATSYLLYFGSEYPYSWTYYQRFPLILFVVNIIVGLFVERHKNILRRGAYVEFVETVKAVSLVMMSTLFLLFCIKSSASYSRVIIIATWLIAIVYVYISRCILKAFLLKRMHTKNDLPYVIILASEEEAVKCVRQLRERDVLESSILGIVLINRNGKGENLEGIPIVSNRKELPAYAMEHVVDEVFVNVRQHSDELKMLLDTLITMGLTVRININTLYEDYPNKRVEGFNGYTVVTSGINIINFKQLFFKRCIDVLGGLVGSLITIMLCIIIGPIIYVMDPGPIFFTQERVGKNGRKFKMYKFRSMYQDAEKKKAELLEQNEMDGMMFKLTNDPRIIGSRMIERDGRKIYKRGFGGFLRASSLDEMPQMFNVLKGDMSLVGTRPPTVDEVEQYELHHKIRLSMKPGITGLWQVSGRNDITDFEEVVKLDKEYIATWSMGLDIKILFKTVYVVFARKGSR